MITKINTYTVFLAGFTLFSLVCFNGVSKLGETDASTINDQAIHVLTYNIHHCNPPSEEDLIDVEAIAKVINTSNADLVALQEVDVNTARSGNRLNQAEKLAELTGMYYHFFKSIDFQGGEYGNAILSRFPINSKKGIYLPYDEGTEPRTVAYIEVTLPWGKDIVFAGTHLDFADEDNTYRQAKYLTEYFLQNYDKPLILAGDFNSVAGQSAIDYLDVFFKRTCEADCSPTIPQINPTKEIDFIFYRPEDHFKVVSHTVVDEPYASDHLPVLAKLISKE